MKNKGHTPVMVKDIEGNPIPMQWSKCAAIDVSMNDFEPGFPFQVFVGTPGDLTVEFWNNGDADLSQPEIEYFAATPVKIVTVNSILLPFAIKKVYHIGTSATDILIGK